MPLKHVSQVHGYGCFIAAAAMLTGRTYKDVFKQCFPKQSFTSWELKVPVIYDVQAFAIRALKKLGCKVRKSSYKKIKSLTKYAKKNVLLIIRWSMDGDTPTKTDPQMCHAVVFDAETKKILDPCGLSSVRAYQRQLDSMYYVEPPKQRKKSSHGKRRNEAGDSITHYLAA